ncbi:MAG: Holliday junction branch migration protein RuvA [Bifidobacteriaceae bacterium]|nr:Holliday junction branch migration protein RuvA [Bifidobacteriaceae bacterium]
MIGSLTGTVETVESDIAIIDVNGIGFAVHMPANDLGRIHMGQEVHVLTSLSVSQDAINLYAFLTKGELDLYRQLLKVSGIGPKVALGVLSTFTPKEFAAVLHKQDTTALTKAPGLGRKGAQKIILELANKLVIDDAQSTEASTPPEMSDTVAQQLVDAMANMGKDPKAAKRAVMKAIEDLGLPAPLPNDKAIEAKVLSYAFRSLDRSL